MEDDVFPPINVVRIDGPAPAYLQKIQTPLEMAVAWGFSQVDVDEWVQQFVRGLKTGRGIHEVSPFGLFHDITYVDEGWAKKLKERCFDDKLIAFIDPHPQYERMWVWHALLGAPGSKTRASTRKPVQFLTKTCHAWFAEVEVRPVRATPDTEADMQRAFCKHLASRGVSFSEQVRCDAGFADVVDREFVYELKVGHVTRERFFLAVGQAVLYASALKRKPCVVLGGKPPDGMDAVAAAIGVRVEVFRGL